MSKENISEIDLYLLKNKGNKKTITTEMMIALSTQAGGYTKSQVEIAKRVYKKKWAQKAVKHGFPDDLWNEMVNAKRKKGKRKKPSFNKTDSWEWKPPKKEKSKRVQQRSKVSALNSKRFYKTKDWLSIRVRVLEKYQCKCMMCGRSPRDHGIVIHVDHIKPRSKYPELSLDFNNLQLLCEACNIGKSNKYKTDWRPVDESLDMELIENQSIKML